MMQVIQVCCIMNETSIYMYMGYYVEAFSSLDLKQPTSITGWKGSCCMDMPSLNELESIVWQFIVCGRNGA